MENLKFVYPAFTGSKGGHYLEITALLHDGKITVRQGNEENTIKVVIRRNSYNHKNCYIYQLRGTQLNLSHEYGLQFLEDGQDEDGISPAWQLMETIINLKNKKH